MSILIPLPRFLQRFWCPPGRVQLFAFREGDVGPIIRWWDGPLGPPPFTNVAPWLLREAVSFNFSPASRKPGAAHGAKVDLFASRVVWLDDPVQGTDSPAKVVAKCEEVGVLRPSCIVRTMQHCQSVWFLREVLDLTTRGGVDTLQLILRALALTLEGDLGAATATHPLACPWTLQRRGKEEFCRRLELWKPNEKVDLEAFPVPPEARVVRPPPYGRRRVPAPMRREQQ